MTDDRNREMMVLPLDKIMASEVAMRTVDRTSEEYLGLVDSIKQKGFITSVTARRKFDPTTGEERYELVDGAQRTSAARDAGLKEINVVVMSMTDADAMEAQLMANVHRVETPAHQYSTHLKRIMMMNPQLTLSVLADRLGKSTTWVSQRLSLVKISDKDIAQLIDDGKICLTNAHVLAKLPPENQRELIDQAIAMSPNEFVPMATKRAKEIRATSRQGDDAKPLEFSPHPFTQKMKTMKEELETKQQGKFLCKKYNPQTREEAFNLGVAWCLHMDPYSQELQRSKYEERERLRQEKKAARLEERKKKAAEQQQKLEEEAAKVQAALDLKE